MAVDAAAAAPIWSQDGSRLVKAEPDEIVYEIIVELPEAGLLPGLVPDVPDKPIAHLPTMIRPKLPFPDDIQRDYAGV